MLLTLPNIFLSYQVNNFTLSHLQIKMESYNEIGYVYQYDN